jgi:hypothetical protein
MRDELEKLRTELREVREKLGVVDVRTRPEG